MPKVPQHSLTNKIPYITQICIFTLQKVTILPIMTDSVFHKIFLITCTGFRLRQRHQTAVLHLNLWKLPLGRYGPAKLHVSEVHLIGYASYFNKKSKKSNLSSKLFSRSKKLTSEQASWIFLKNYLGILRPGSNWLQVWHLDATWFHLKQLNKCLKL